MSYRTLKVVKISDQRLAYVHKTLMASILVYSAISMVGSHTYMLKEKPRMYVAMTVDDSLRLSNFTLATAAYCDVADTDFAGDTFVAEGAYLDNQCAEHFATSQLTRLTDAGAFVGTHVQTQDWTRTCDDDATLSGCVLNDDGDAKNYFPADVDAIALQFRPTYVTSWGVSEPPTTIFAMDVEGEEVDYFYVYDDDPDKRTPKFTIQELLTLANVSLADTNPVYVSSNFTGRLPSYKINGRAREPGLHVQQLPADVGGAPVPLRAAGEDVRERHERRVVRGHRRGHVLHRRARCLRLRARAWRCAASRSSSRAKG